MIENEQIRSEVLKLYRLAAKDDQSAADWLAQFDFFLHQAETFIRQKQTDPQAFIKLLASSNLLYGHSFYAAHASVLQSPVICCFLNLGEAIKWQNSPLDWQSNWAQTLNLSIVEVVRAVATVFGIAHAQSVSGQIRELAWASRSG